MEKDVIPLRKDVPAENKWNLSSLYKNDELWEKELSEVPSLIKNLASWKGKMGLSKENFLSCLKDYEKLYCTLENLYCYSSLLHTSDESDSASQDKEGRALMAYAKAGEESAFFSPELMSIPEDLISEWLKSKEFDNYRIFVQKELYEKPYILSEKEERILSLASETAQASANTFSLLENVDLKFQDVNVNGKSMPLTQSTFTLFLHNPDRAVRKQAYKNFYQGFLQNQNVLASLYAGSVNSDVFYSRARGYASSLQASLYSDKVDEKVYRNLIDTVHKNFSSLHNYYALRKKILGVEQLRHYDVYVPLVPEVHKKTTYEQAVEICRKALSPLGQEYTDTLCSGLLNGWVDRYENKGKRSGAYSSGTYTSDPYILLNYKDDSIRDLFTMAHEGGHSMHSWYSKNNNPYLSYNYTIFEAEVASTFNEELVFEYLLNNAQTPQLKAYLLSMRADDILATLHRQTMFAEFELKAHETLESGTPLNSSLLRQIYGDLLHQYFGPEMAFEDESNLEGLRIPHFYNAFYVYKYATGISASLALAKRVTGGGEKERQDYFNFLKSGGSKYPLESLKLAGVDMADTAPVQDALNTFNSIVLQLEQVLKTLPEVSSS